MGVRRYSVGNLSGSLVSRVAVLLRPCKPPSADAPGAVRVHARWGSGPNGTKSHRRQTSVGVAQLVSPDAPNCPRLDDPAVACYSPGQRPGFEPWHPREEVVSSPWADHFAVVRYGCCLFPCAPSPLIFSSSLQGRVPVHSTAGTFRRPGKRAGTPWTRLGYPKSSAEPGRGQWRAARLGGADDLPTRSSRHPFRRVPGAGRSCRVARA